MDYDHFITTGKVKCSVCDKIKYKLAYPKKLSLEIQKINTCVYIAPRDSCILHELG